MADSGADICVFPASLEDKKRPCQTPLAAANGSTIRTWGKRNIALHLGKRTFSQEFILAEVTRPILGANFFANHFLIMDLARKRLLDAAEDDWAGTPREAKIICQVEAEKEGGDEFQQLLNDFKSILTPDFKFKKNKHQIYHYIPTS